VRDDYSALWRRTVEPLCYFSNHAIRFLASSGDSSRLIDGLPLSPMVALFAFRDERTSVLRRRVKTFGARRHGFGFPDLRWKLVAYSATWPIAFRPASGQVLLAYPGGRETLLARLNWKQFCVLKWTRIHKQGDWNARTRQQHGILLDHNAQPCLEII
jgi:hypothetical protein